MRICILCYRGNPYSGGQGIYLKYLAEELVRQGHEVHAVTGPPYPVEMKGVRVHYIHNNEYFIKKGSSIINNHTPFDVLSPLNLFEFAHTRINGFPEILTFSIRAYYILKKLMKQAAFDIIHDNQCLGYGLLLIRQLGVPVVATIHHPLSIDRENAIERASGLRNKMKGVFFYPLSMHKFVSRRLDHIITVSEDSRKKVAADYGVPESRQTVVYNGLDTKKFKPLPGIKKRKGKILFVGNVEDGKKGFVYLLKAMCNVREDAVLHVIDGGAPHRKLTGQLIQKLNISKKIKFQSAASIDELVQQYCEAEIVIVPSVYEGFGFPAAEAMACGTPVIASDGGALPEVVGDAGIIVPSRNETVLYETINTLLSDRKQMKNMSRAGLQRIRSRFTWAMAVEAVLDVYRRVQ